MRWSWTASSPVLRTGLLVVAGLAVLVVAGRLGGATGNLPPAVPATTDDAPRPQPERPSEPWVTQRIQVDGDQPGQVSTSVAFVGDRLLALTQGNEGASAVLYEVDPATGQASPLPVPERETDPAILVGSGSHSWMGGYLVPPRRNLEPGEAPEAAEELGVEPGEGFEAELRLVRVPADRAGQGDVRTFASTGFLLVAGHQSGIWLTCCEPDAGRGRHPILHLDAASLATVGEVVLDRPVCGLAEGPDTLWAVDAGGTVHLVDPRTDQALTRIDAGAGRFRVPEGLFEEGLCHAVTATPEGAWVLLQTASGSAVAFIDARGRSVEAWPLHTTTGPVQAYGLVRVNGALLVLGAGGALHRVDARGEVIGSARVPEPTSMVVGRGALWVGTITGEILRIDPHRITDRPPPR